MEGNHNLNQYLRYAINLGVMLTVGCYSNFDAPRDPTHLNSENRREMRGRKRLQNPAAKAHEGEPSNRSPSSKTISQSSHKEQSLGKSKNNQKTRDKEKEKPKKPEQSYHEAWGMICNAEKLSNANSQAKRLVRGNHIAHWIVQHVTNKKARYWFISLGNLKDPEKPATFRKEAQKAGYPDCPLEHFLFQDQTPQKDAQPVKKEAQPAKKEAQPAKK